MEIKLCPFCGSSAEIGDHRLMFSVDCLTCKAGVLGVRAPEPDEQESECDEYWNFIKATAIDAWNSRVEQNPSEADRWLAEATEQRARADLAEMQRDELAVALEQAKKILIYKGE